MASNASSTSSEFQALHQEVFDAHGKDTAPVAGVNMISPVIMESPTGLLGTLSEGHEMGDAPSDTLVLTGQTKLFDRDDLLVEFYSYHGPDRNGKLTLDSGDPVVYQLAAFDRGQTIPISDLVPKFKGTLLDSISVQNVNLAYQNTQVDEHKGIGMSLEADILFDEKSGPIHDVFNKVLGIGKPQLHVACGLGTQDWHKPLSVFAFDLEGTFLVNDDNTKPAVSAFKIHTLGARVSGYHANDNPDGTPGAEPTYEWGVFGELELSLLPVPLSFDFAAAGDLVTLTLSMNDWKSAFRVPGLTLQNLTLSSTFDPKDVKETIAFDIEATMDLGSSSSADIVTFKGTYSADGYSLEATFEEFSFSHLNGIFSHLYSYDLTAPQLNVEFGSTTLSLTGDHTTTEFKLDVHHLSVDGHSASEVQATISSKGINFTVDFAEDLSYPCNGETLTIKDAGAAVAFVADRKDEKGEVVKGSTDVLIHGILEWSSFTLKAGLHLYTEDGKTEFTAVAQFDSNDGVALSTIIPKLKGTMFDDVTLQNAGVAFASKKDGQSGPLGLPCDLEAGFQVYAVLGEMTGTKTIMKDQQLILRAGWSKSEFALEFDIICNAPHINLGKGAVVREIELVLDLSGSPQIRIKGDVSIPISHQPTPLDLEMELSLSALKASAGTKLSSTGGWNNPFGLTKELTIEMLELSVEIVYETFPEIGPESFGFGGSFKIDGVEVDVNFKVSEDPAEELLYATIPDKPLTLANVVNFTGSLMGVDLPQPPNVIIFNKAKICVSPLGATVDDVQYPAGFSFNADVVLFGVEGCVAVSIGSSGLQCSGSVTPFKLGPLQVSGGKPGTPAQMELCVTKDQQSGKIDGAITIFGIQTMIYFTFQTHPKLTFEFYFMLTFAEIFDFKVSATKVEAISPSNPNATQGVYTLQAEFHQEMRDHIGQKISDLFKEKARLEAQKASDREAEIKNAKQALEDKINLAEQQLKVAEAAKTARIDKETAEANKRLDAQRAVAKEKLDAFNSAQKSLRDKIDAEKASFAAQTAASSQKIDGLQKKLEADKKHWDDEIGAKHRALDAASQALQTKFNDVQNTIRAAEAKVAGLNGQISNIENRISQCKNAHWYDIASKAAIPGLEVEELALKAAMGIATLALEGANKIVGGLEYAAVKDAVPIAQAALTVAQTAGDSAIKLSEGAITAEKNVLQGLSAGLQAALDVANKAGNALIVAAKEALDLAQTAVTNLEKDLNSIEATLKDAAEFVEYKAAEDALALAKAGGSAALTIAGTAVKAYDEVDEELLKVWDAILTDMTKYVDVTEVILTGQVGGSASSVAFSAEIKGTFNDHFWHYSITYDHNAVEQFFKDLFDKLVDEVEQGIINPAKKIIRTVEGQEGAVVVNYGPNGTYTITHA